MNLEFNIFCGIFSSTSFVECAAFNYSSSEVRNNVRRLRPAWRFASLQTLCFAPNSVSLPCQCFSFNKNSRQSSHVQI